MSHLPFVRQDYAAISRWRDGHWLASYCGQCDFRYLGAMANPLNIRNGGMPYDSAIQRCARQHPAHCPRRNFIATRLVMVGLYGCRSGVALRVNAPLTSPRIKPSLCPRSAQRPTARFAPAAGGINPALNALPAEPYSGHAAFHPFALKRWRLSSVIAGPHLSHAMFAVWLALLPRMVRSVYSAWCMMNWKRVRHCRPLRWRDNAEYSVVRHFTEYYRRSVNRNTALSMAILEYRRAGIL